MEHTGQYRHQTLPRLDEGDTDPYIRLLELHPGGKEGPITCNIKQTRLSDAELYEALSYCWGDPTRKSEIYVTATPWSPGSDVSLVENSEPLLVPRSVIPFLYRTRAHPSYKDKVTILWIDSICINQDDYEERNEQVKCMRDIYVHAEHTAIWLGPYADRSDDALEYIRLLSRKYIFMAMADRESEFTEAAKQEKKEVDNFIVKVGDPVLEAVLALFARPYFERAWIVQEMVVSKSAYIAVGDSSQSWETMFLGIAYISQHCLSILEFYPQERLLNVMFLMFSKMQWDNGLAVKWWTVLARHRGARSGDPRDKIFALWGLKCEKQLQELGVEPEYRESVENIYWKLSYKSLEKGDAIILSIPRINIEDKDKEAGMKNLNIPSWVTDWRWTDGTVPSLSLQEMEGIKESQEPSIFPPFNASDGSTFSCAFENLDPGSNFPNTLVLRGYVIAQITHITSQPWTKAVLHHKTIFSQARSLQFVQEQIANWEHVLIVQGSRSRIYGPTGESCFIAYYKTLRAGTVAVHAGDIQRSEEYTLKMYEAVEYRQRVLRILRNIGLGGYIWIYIIIVLLERLTYSLIKYENPEFRLQTNTTSRVRRKGARLIGEVKKNLPSETQKRHTMEYLALVPAQAKLGDVVVLCEGATVPLVLRRKVLEGENAGVFYELVGDTYVHGLMEGEFWNAGSCEELRIM